MQISTTILAIAIEVYLVLTLGLVVLFFFSIKQKKIIRRQQDKLLELIKEIRQASHTPAATSVDKGYKFHLNKQLETTQNRFNLQTSDQNINEIQPFDASLEQRVLALRYAFLRAEELGTTEDVGSEAYWNIFKQTLEPLLSKPIETASNKEELELYKQRVNNLEQFKKLFFDLEAQWNSAQTNAENQYLELMSYAGQTSDPLIYQQLLEGYRSNYGEFGKSVLNTSSILGNNDSKTINIYRQDPNAAEEIIKLRNVAADQYRVINNLQRKLEEAISDEQKALVIQELEQQLQRHIRFVQESDTCVQLLEEELIKANEKIAEQEQLIVQSEQVGVENNQIKGKLHSFSLESKDLLATLESLEEENKQLKEQLQSTNASTKNAQ